LRSEPCERLETTGHRINGELSDRRPDVRGMGKRHPNPRSTP
jgi:hypothetical protein